MSYEDYARQFQLNRYAKLIERLASPGTQPTVEEGGAERTQTDEVNDGPMRDQVNSSTSSSRTKSDKDRFDQIIQHGFQASDLKELLTDRTSIIRFGRFLRSQTKQPTSDSIRSKTVDVLEEDRIDTRIISSQIGMISEQMNRLKFQLETIRRRVFELQTSSTIRLADPDHLSARLETIVEAKILLGSIDGLQLCLQDFDGHPSHHRKPSNSLMMLASARLPDHHHRDLLRVLSRVKLEP